MKRKAENYVRCKEKILKYRCFLNKNVQHTTHMTSHDEKTR